MQDGQPVKIIVLSGRRRGAASDEQVVCVVDHYEREDLPAAIGYFVLNFMDELAADEVRVTTATAPCGMLFQPGITNVRFNSLHGAEYGNLFQVIRQVESNERPRPRPGGGPEGA